MVFCIVSEGIFQLNKKGIKIQIASEIDGKHSIFQNQEALVNLNFKTRIQKARKIKITLPLNRNNILFDIINSLLFI
jgi:hypothetical protein